jgi:type II secretory pathway component PulC
MTPMPWGVELALAAVLAACLVACKDDEPPQEEDSPRRRRSSSSESAPDRKGMPLGEIHIVAKDGSYEVNEDSLLQVIALAQGDALPVSRALTGGYRVDSAPDGSVLARAGLLAEDVVTAINGVPIDDAAILAKAYPLVSVAKAITLTVSRKGETISLIYQVVRRGRALAERPPTRPLLEPSDPEPEEILDERIAKKGEHSWELKKSLADELSANGFARSMRIIPTRDGDAVVGLKLYGIRAKSIPRQLGFMNGDTVLRLNGEAIGEPEAALAAYQKSRGKSYFRVDIERRGKPLTLEYRLVD